MLGFGSGLLGHRSVLTNVIVLCLNFMKRPKWQERRQRREIHSVEEDKMCWLAGVGSMSEGMGGVKNNLW